jgi:hypothetical protein
MHASGMSLLHKRKERAGGHVTRRWQPFLVNIYGTCTSQVARDMLIVSSGRYKISDTHLYTAWSNRISFNSLVRRFVVVSTVWLNSKFWFFSDVDFLYCTHLPIQGVIESCTDILTTSYWLHVKLGKNI